jgi:ribulose-5-phosphate 4-epimerase/fuculose-1-phosphate aldolase
MTSTALRRPVIEERLYRQQRLAATLRLFARAGFDEGAGGHVTARDPADPDCFWINPFGVPFAHVRVSDLLLVDSSGAVISGSGTVNPAGFVIHSHVHAARPDVVAVAHTHSVHGRAWATLGRKLDPLTQDACAFYDDHDVYDGFDGVVLEPEEGKNIGERLGTGKAVILRNHGLLTVGTSVQEACWWFINMERSCQVQLLAEAAGKPVPIPPDVARRTAAVMGTASMGRLNFRTLYLQIVRAQPDLLE